GDPTDPACFRFTTSAVMKENSTEPATFHVFDDHSVSLPFQQRLFSVERRIARVPHAKVVDHEMMRSAKELREYEADMVARGYEGVMVRSIDGPYKNGRSTAREGWLLKLKR